MKITYEAKFDGKRSAVVPAEAAASRARLLMPVVRQCPNFSRLNMPKTLHVHLVFQKSSASSDLLSTILGRSSNLCGR